MSSTYVTIRDDSGLRSLSVNERNFLRSCALRGSDDVDHDDNNDTSQKILRVDGRRGNDVRKVRLQLGRWDNGAECTVQWGVGTRVTALCTAELVPPSPDRPNEGMANFTVDLSPMASPSFKLAPPISTGPSSTSNMPSTSKGSNHSDQSQRLLSNRILRCIEKIILVGGALDTEALVLEGGKWVWRLTVALTVLDSGGNILDACVFAAMAALRHYRKPRVDLSSDGVGEDDNTDPNAASLPIMIPSTIKEATPLPLHHTPLSISFGLIPADDADNSTSSTSIVAALIDPTDREELVQSGSLTIAMNVHSEVCLLDYGGGCELTPNKLRECWKVAEIAMKKLCQMLETALTNADEQAQKERLHRLQLQRVADLPPLPPLPSSDIQNIPFLQQIEDMDVDSKIDEAQMQQIQSEAEEAYRKQALDYASGHVATVIREDNETRSQSKVAQPSGSLLASMLKSVGQSAPASSVSKDDRTKERADNVDGKPSAKAPSETADVVIEKTMNDALNQKQKNMEEDDRKNVGTHSKDHAINSDIPVHMDIDDDEEEEEQPTILHSEFDSINKEESKPISSKATSHIDKKVEEDDDDNDIDDLAMAIKSKKNKKKKSKKK